jgi:hypothetical protein
VCFLDTGFHSILSTASTTLLSLSFVFSVTAQEFLGSCIFLFVKHPYDIGDRVHIYGPDGVNSLEVQQISLLYTGFKRVSDLESIQVSCQERSNRSQLIRQIPNNILNTLWINNISRSKGMMERIDVYISLDTPFEDIEALRMEMEGFVGNADNKREFQPDIVLRCVGVGTMDKLQLQLEVRHKSNWSVEAIRVARHSKLMCALLMAMRKVPVFGPAGGAAPLGDPANPSYNVTVSDEYAAMSREKAAKAADAARLHPVRSSTANQGNMKPTGRGSTEYGDPGSVVESAAADGLNAMHLENVLKDDEEDDGNVNTTRHPRPSNESSTTILSGPQGGESLELRKSKSPQGGESLESRKSKSPQGRRRAGVTGPSLASIISQQSQDNEASRIGSGTGTFDQEAQSLA